MAPDNNPYKMPPHVRAEVQRILDDAARRLLAEGYYRDDASGTLTKKEGKA